MENYKIKVNTPEESERAQRAFFALGNVWLIGRKTVCNTCYKYLYANSEGFGIIEYGKTQKEFDTDESKEITLPELEALAQKAQIGEGLNSFETMVEEKTSIQSNIEKARGNGWQADGRDADEQVNELRGNTDLANVADLTNLMLFVYQKDGEHKALTFKEAREQAAELTNEGWAHVATLNAKEFVEHHYGQESEAQRRYEAAKDLVDEIGHNEIWPYLERIDQALRIAAGLE